MVVNIISKQSSYPPEFFEILHKIKKEELKYFTTCHFVNSHWFISKFGLYLEAIWLCTKIHCIDQLGKAGFHMKKWKELIAPPKIKTCWTIKCLLPGGVSINIRKLESAEEKLKPLSSCLLYPICSSQGGEYACVFNLPSENIAYWSSREEAFVSKSIEGSFSCLDWYSHLNVYVVKAAAAQSQRALITWSKNSVKDLCSFWVRLIWIISNFLVKLVIKW